MRYLIKHKAAADAGKDVFLVTFSAVMAENQEEAARLFQKQHPDRIVVDATPATDERQAFDRYGMGAMTDEEQAAHRAKLNDRYDRLKVEHEAAREYVGTYTLEEFYTEQQHQQRRDCTTTPNLDGVYVGDIFVACWGYDQTNYDFYQVVALKGKRTAIVQELNCKSELCSDWSGYKRPIRDSFKDETTYTLRTKTGWYNGYDSGPKMNVPDLSGHHTMDLVEFGKLYQHSTGA